LACGLYLILFVALVENAASLAVVAVVAEMVEAAVAERAVVAVAEAVDGVAVDSKLRRDLG
jgi:hypothetical protein